MHTHDCHRLTMFATGNTTMAALPPNRYTERTGADGGAAEGELLETWQAAFDTAEDD